MANNDNRYGEAGANRDTNTRGVRRRSFLATAGTGAAAVALAGCLDGGGASADGLTIGHVAPMESPLGIGSLRSANLAAASVNDADGVAGGEVEIVDRSTQGAASEAQSVAEELIQQEEVDVLVGTFASEVALSLIDLTSETGVPFLTTGPASPQITRDHAGEDYETYKNVFRVGPINSDFQAEAMTGYCGTLQEAHGWDNVAFLRDNAAWTTPFEELLPGYLDEAGIDIVYESALSIESPDLSSVMNEVAETDADYILRFFAHIDGSPMLANWHEGQYDFGIEGIHVTGMFPSYFQASQGVALYETTSQSGAAGVTEITEKTVPFVEAYREQFGDADAPPYRAPMYMGFNTYDAVEIASNVVDETGEAPRSNLDGFVDAMLDVSHTGVAGQLEFYGPDADYPHDVRESRNDAGVIENFPVTQWQEGGELECVYPETYSTASHVQPEWMR